MTSPRPFVIAPQGGRDWYSAVRSLIQAHRVVRNAGLSPALHPDLLAHLEGLAGKDTPEEYVMPSLAGLESGGKRGLSRQFHQLMHDAGVDRREVTNPAGRKFAKRSFHSLRHTFASDLANSGSNPELTRLRLF